MCRRHLTSLENFKLKVVGRAEVEDERFALEVSDDYIKKALERYKPRGKIAKCPTRNAEDREQVGTSSRQKQKFTHTAGSRSFASVAEAGKSRPIKKLDAFSFLRLRIGRKMDLL
ncbi:Deoxycytidylate 5-hydroxymethyltransferase [Gossypium arboreum]|uniref:Deoxycytidylate 5-hydroxymethyltransferase n=1 Tax=Gossypium arboreum TaxID=29729 RepID=A0A0B0PQE0_GOSAR|nr:Deoxycytidylate 5-hydroxymethyltransferase [Gossypium arboreum]